MQMTIAPAVACAMPFPELLARERQAEVELVQGISFFNGR